MELETLANVSEVVGAAVVVGSVAFALLQLTQFRRHRFEMVAVEVVRSLQTPEFTHAIRLVLTLPDDASAEKVRENSEVEDAAMLVSLTLESVGILVHRRMASLEMVWELMGGVTLATYRKTRVWGAQIRREQGNQKFHEWLEWLCNQLEVHEKGDEPAHVQYRDWQPEAANRWTVL